MNHWLERYRSLSAATSTAPTEHSVSPSSAGEGAREVMAVKVWSDILGEPIWVVADHLPQDEWPTDAPVYTQHEVRILKQVGQDTMAWVHAVKASVGSRVLDGRQRHTGKGEQEMTDEPPSTKGNTSN
jgi:hypothetical protein